MEPHIVLLNGPAGAGKSTVGRHLATLHPGTVCIAGDALRAFTPADSTAARALLGPGSTYRAAGALARAYLGMGARRVVFEYVFENPAHVEHFRRSAPAGVPLYLFTLWAPLAVITAREARRHSERAPLGARVEACYRAMEPHVSRLGLVVSTEGRTAEQVAHDIDAQLRGSSMNQQSVLQRPPSNYHHD